MLIELKKTLLWGMSAWIPFAIIHLVATLFCSFNVSYQSMVFMTALFGVCFLSLEWITSWQMKHTPHKSSYSDESISLNVASRDEEMIPVAFFVNGLLFLTLSVVVGYQTYLRISDAFNSATLSYDDASGAILINTMLVCVVGRGLFNKFVSKK